jgi:flagellin-like hook-associated protein FlgL
MNADPVSEPALCTDEDVLGRLAAIDHRLHQLSTQLTTMGTLLDQLEEICANLETLIGSLRSAGRW